MQIDSLLLRYTLPREAERALSLQRTSAGAELLFSPAGQRCALPQDAAQALLAQIRAFPLARWCEAYRTTPVNDMCESGFSLFCNGKLYSAGQNAFPRDFAAFLQLFSPFCALLPQKWILHAEIDSAYGLPLHAYLDSGMKKPPASLRREIICDAAAGTVLFSGKRYPCAFLQMQALLCAVAQLCARDAFVPQTERQRLLATTVTLVYADGAKACFSLPYEKNAALRAQVLAPQFQSIFRQPPLYERMLPLPGERVCRCLRVEFEPRAEKSYLYLENGIGAKTGDFAVVPVAKYGEKERIARIIAIEEYPVHLLPLPAEKLRSALRICIDPEYAVRPCPVSGTETDAAHCTQLQRRLFAFSLGGQTENPQLEEQRLLCERCCFHRDLPPF